MKLKKMLKKYFVIENNEAKKNLNDKGEKNGEKNLDKNKKAKNQR